MANYLSGLRVGSHGAVIWCEVKAFLREFKQQKRET